MYDSLFWLNILSAFIVGGVWITVTTIITDRWGTKLGGFIGGLPSTAAVSFFFIGLSQSPEAVFHATTVFPLTYGFTGIFLVSYALLARRGFLFGLIGSLAIWCILSATVAIFHFDNFVASLVIYGLILIVSLCILNVFVTIKSVKSAPVKLSLCQLIARGFFGGCMIGFTVFISKVGGPIFGGIFAAFPAFFISTLYISYQSQGLAFSRTIAKPLLVTGMITIVAYGVAVRYLYPSQGLILGTLFSLLVSALSAYFTYNYLQKKCA